MAKSNRDDFTKDTIRNLAERVAYLCSNPNCRVVTVGPNEDCEKSTKTGVAAHITAAAPGGPRYDNTLSSEERTHITNGIWLCSTCSTIIDKNEKAYSVNLLKRWKNDCEQQAKSHQTNIQLEAKLSEISKIPYPKPNNYISRNIISSENYTEYYYLYPDKTTTLLKAVEDNNLTMLLGDAGSGKSIELQELAYQLCILDTSIFPIYIKLNTYVGEKIKDLIPQEYKNSPKENLIFILDGFDEIEQKNTNDFTKKLESFIEGNSNAKFVISSRTNFYKNPQENYSGTIKGFTTYSICPLTIANKKNYLKSKNIDEENFYKEVSKNNSSDLLALPFYLIHIVELFLKNNKLPPRNDLMENLVESKFKFDREKFRTTKDVSNSKTRLMWLLQKTGVALECLGRNYLSDDEYQLLLAEDDRDLLSYSGIWTKNNEVNWQFIHNNFGEYLAAKHLAKKPLDKIIQTITYKFDNTNIKPTWTNTLSYLASFYVGNALRDWLTENSPQLLIKFERDRFDNAERVDIFKQIFTSYTEKAMWIDYNVMKDLIVFGESKKVLLFLLDEIESPKNIQSLKNALDLLYIFNNTFNLKEKIIKVMSLCIFDDSNDEFVKNRAILTLANLKLQNEELTNKLICKFSDCDKSYIRYGMYVYLHTSESLDENIEFFLDGLKYHFVNTHTNDDEESRIGNESTELLEGISKIKTIEAFEKVINYIIKKQDRYFDYILEEVMKNILLVAEKLYSIYETKIFNILYELIPIILNSCNNEAEQSIIKFLDNTDTRVKAFVKLAQEPEFKHKYLLNDLADDKCSVEFNKLYCENKIEKETAENFANRMNQNTTEFDELSKLIKEKIGNEVEKRTNDYAKRYKDGSQNYFNSLFNKDEFQKMIDEIIKLSENDKLIIKDAIDYKNAYIYKREDLKLTVWDVYHWFKREDMLLSEFSKEVNFENFSINQIYDMLKNRNKDIVVSDIQLENIKNFFDTNIIKVNFEEVIKYKDDMKCTFSSQLLILVFFMVHFKFECDEKILLDMLMFPFDTNIKIDKQQQSYFEYIEQRVKPANMKQRVIFNLENKNLMGEAYEQHIKYCTRNNIEDVKDISIGVCIDANRSEWVKRTSIDYLVMLLQEDMMDKEDFYNDVAIKLDDKTLLYISEKLYENNDEQLVEIIKERFNECKTECKKSFMAYLIYMNCDVAIKYYIDLLKETNQTPEESSIGNNMTKAIGSISDVNELPLIIELLNILFTDGFKDCRFQSLSSSIRDSLLLIGEKNEGSYNRVKETLESILITSESNIPKIRFINTILEDLKDRFLKNMEHTVTIEEVIFIIDKL